MSTANPAPALGASATASELRRPLLWLLAILAIGVAIRVLHTRDKPFQLEEFTTLAAIAERKDVDVGTTPTDQDPLVPVSSLGEVSNRSVIPFGIQDPVPLYHQFLWGIIQVAPVNEWTLRLPSLLAGVACIAAVFFLLRRPFGAEMALVAALFVALDPIQIGASRLARPFALANLFVVLSFASLWGLMQSYTTSKAVLLALAYAVCVAILGYLSGLYLCVVLAHLLVVLYGRRYLPDSDVNVTAWWAGGLVLALVMLAPELPYFYHLAVFGQNHADYLKAVHDIHLYRNGPIQTIFWHNLVFLGGLVVVLVAGAVVRMQLQGGTDEKPEGETTPRTTESPAGGPGGGLATAVTTAPSAAPTAAAAPPEPARPLPENDQAMQMARLWLFLPQMALLIAFFVVPGVFITRYLTYTTLAGAIVLAYYATRDGSREVRLGVAGFLALALLVVGFWPDMFSGTTLFSNTQAKTIAGTISNANWKGRDVVLMRSGLIESDLLATDIPKETRPQVERVLVAPLTLLYTDTLHKPIIPLPMSAYRNEKVRTTAGDKVNTAKYYDEEFIKRVSKYNRFWFTGVAPTAYPNSWAYMACIAPPLVTALHRGNDKRGEMWLARNRGNKNDPEHYISIPPNLPADGSIPGLVPKPDQTVPEGLKDGDFALPLHILRPPDKK